MPLTPNLLGVCLDQAPLVFANPVRAFQSGDPPWMAYQQALEKKWHVLKWEKATTIFFSKPYEVEDDETDEGLDQV